MEQSQSQKKKAERLLGHIRQNWNDNDIKKINIATADDDMHKSREMIQKFFKTKKERKMKKDKNIENQRKEPSNSMSDFPSSIIMEILTRLPIKTIFTCRCVCKFWHGILSDPHFAKLHLMRAHTTLMLGTNHSSWLDESSNLYLVDLEGEESPYSLTPTKLNMRFNFRHQKLIPMTSCNGLMLCYGVSKKDYDYYVCNPILGEYTVLPKFETESIHRVLGFGFSPDSKQYKMMQLLFTSDAMPYVEIYTLGTDRWRSIGAWPHSSISLMRFGVCFNGALHWLLGPPDDSLLICSFDVGNEQYRQLLGPSGPNFGPYPKYACTNMGVLRDYLYICVSSSHVELDIWVMKKYGVKESWMKEVSIVNPIMPGLRASLYERIIILNYGINRNANFTEGAEMLLLYDTLVLNAYDPGSNSITEVEIRGTRSDYDAITHVASFVSLHDIVTKENPKPLCVKAP